MKNSDILDINLERFEKMLRVGNAFRLFFCEKLRLDNFVSRLTDI